MCVLDCGAAPGSWSQLAIQWTGRGGKVIGCDLLDIKPLKHLDFIKGDLTKPETIEEIIAKMPQKKLMSLSLTWLQTLWGMVILMLGDQ